MNKLNNKINQIPSFSDEMLSRIHQLDEPIPLVLQNEYFHNSAQLKAAKFAMDDEEIMYAEETLFDPDVPEDIKKLYLSRIASGVRIEALRLIEKFLASDILSQSLRQWALMAEMEAKIGVISEIMDEKQIALTTGLGGHNGMMRMMGLVFHKNILDFEVYQENLLRKEFELAISQNKGEIEVYECKGHYCLFKFLMPFSAPIANVFEDYINKCNQIGDFLSPKYYITNTEIIREERAKRLIEKYNQTSTTEADNKQGN